MSDAQRNTVEADEARVAQAVAELATLNGKEIRFADIRKGDRLCVLEANTRDGSETRTGVASILQAWGWETEKGILLAVGDAPWQGIFLLHRPTPPPPTEPGSMVIATYRGSHPERFARVLGDDGAWRSLLGTPTDPARWATWTPVTLGDTVTMGAAA